MNFYADLLQPLTQTKASKTFPNGRLDLFLCSQWQLCRSQQAAGDIPSKLIPDLTVLKIFVVWVWLIVKKWVCIVEIISVVWMYKLKTRVEIQLNFINDKRAIVGWCSYTWIKWLEGCRLFIRALQKQVILSLSLTWRKESFWTDKVSGIYLVSYNNSNMWKKAE